MKKPKAIKPCEGRRNRTAQHCTTTLQRCRLPLNPAGFTVGRGLKKFTPKSKLMVTDCVAGRGFEPPISKSVNNSEI